MRPYPWEQKKQFDTERKTGEKLDEVGKVLSLLAAVMSAGLTFVIRVIAYQRYVRVNDSWAKRGLALALTGGLLVWFVAPPQTYGMAWYDLALSFGNRATMEPREAGIAVFLTGLPWALILQSAATMLNGYAFEYNGERFLMATRPTFGTKARARRNARRMRRGKLLGSKFIQFGVIVDDPVPWRTPRHGVIAERTLKDLGHGSIVGMNGTGKTVLCVDLCTQAAAKGAGVFYLDFKASGKTRRDLISAAAAAGVPLHSFELGIDSNQKTSYTPLGWHGSPADKASMLVTSFSFAQSGDAQVYKNVAEQWLTLQFEVLEQVGLNDRESEFDFLATTTTPANLKDRLAPLKTSEPEAYTRFVSRAQSVNSSALMNLVASLSAVTSAGGDQMRPGPEKKPISLSEVANEGGIIYIGLSAATNETALKTIGSLILRDLAVLTGERMKQDRKTLRPVFTLVDEASRMGERADVLDNIFTTAREADVALWVATQSFSSWPSKTITEMNNNVATKITFRVQDSATAEAISRSMGVIPQLNEMTQITIEHVAFEGASRSSDEGSARQTVTEGPLVTAGELQSIQALPNYHAYVQVSGSRNRPTRKKWRSKRVRKDQVGQDAPLVKVCPVNAPTPSAEDFDSAPVSGQRGEQPLVIEQPPRPADTDTVAGRSTGSTVGNFRPSNLGQSFDDGPAPASPSSPPALVEQVEPRPTEVGDPESEDQYVPWGDEDVPWGEEDADQKKTSPPQPSPEATPEKPQPKGSTAPSEEVSKGDRWK